MEQKTSDRPFWRQGDIFFVKLDREPDLEGAKAVKTGVIARGETTGHAHRVSNSSLAAGAALMLLGREMYLKTAEAGATIVHEEHGPRGTPRRGIRRRQPAGIRRPPVADGPRLTMKAIEKSQKAVREALAREGWRFSLVSSVRELNEHRHRCRHLTLPVGSESDNRVRTIRERLLRQLPWELRGQPFPRWMSYISKDARKRLQPHMPLAGGRWRIHRDDAPVVILADREFFFFRGWQVNKRTLTQKPTTDRILAEENQTDREVLLQRMGVDNFVRDAELKPADTFRDSVLLKVGTAQKQGRWRNGEWVEAALPLGFLKVICPSTQHVYFLRVNPDVETAKQALESTLPRYPRDWAEDLVAET